MISRWFMASSRASVLSTDTLVLKFFYNLTKNYNLQYESPSIILSIKTDQDSDTVINFSLLFGLGGKKTKCQKRFLMMKFNWNCGRPISCQISKPEPTTQPTFTIVVQIFFQIFDFLTCEIFLDVQKIIFFVLISII